MLQPDTEGFTQLALAQTNGDERLFVLFKTMPAQNAERSAEEGRPIYEDLDYIEIRAPGDRDVIIRPATEQDKARFPRHYAAFKAGREQDVVGTPLAVVPWITRAQVEELAFFKVKTVEQLAAMSDANAQKFAGIQTLRAKAKDFLDAAAGAAPAEKLRAELAQRDAEIAALKTQMAAFEAELKKHAKGK